MFPEDPQNNNGLNDESDDIFFGDNLEDFEDIVGTEPEDFDDGISGEDPENTENENAETDPVTIAGDNRAQEKTERPKLRFEDRTVSGIARGIRDWVVGNWQAFSLRGKIFTAASVVAGLALIIIAVVVLNYSPWVMTFGAADTMEAAQITSILDVNRIKYDYRRDSSAIYVREADQAAAIGALMDAGHWFRGIVLPVETGGGDLFETEADKKERHKSNLQNRLKAALVAMADVEDAVVNLVIPDNSRTIFAGDRQPSKASVMLILKQGVTLSDESVRGIENTLMRSVEGLETENITITDGNMKTLNIYEEETVDANLNYHAMLEIKTNYENAKARELEQKVIWALESFFPEARAVAAVQTDFNKVLREVIEYIGANEDEDGIQTGIPAAEGIDRILSSASSDEVWGNIGTDANADATGYYETPLNTELANFMDALHITRENLIGQVLEQMERTTPEITGITIWATADGEYEYEEDEVERYIIGLANATGISDIIRAQITAEEDFYDKLFEYVTLTVAPFWTPREEWEPDPVFEGNFNMFEFWLAFGGGLILLVMFAVLLIAISRRAKRIREEEEIEEVYIGGYGPVPAGTSGEMDAFARAISKSAVAEEISGGGEEMSIEMKEEHLKKQIRIFVDQNPDIAAQLIKTLLKGDEANG
jgi:flagellar M-ring protein FliF